MVLKAIKRSLDRSYAYFLAFKVKRIELVMILK